MNPITEDESQQSSASHVKNPGCLGYIGEYTTQLCGFVSWLTWTFRHVLMILQVVCHFDKASDCGGRNCGSHGVCVHL